jgi:hypothetical protein
MPGKQRLENGRRIVSWIKRHGRAVYDKWPAVIRNLAIITKSEFSRRADAD